MTNLTCVLLLTLLAGFTVAQKPQPRKSTKTKNVKQGICGTLVEKRGNFMPSPDAPARVGSPAEREVLVFPVMTMDQVDMGENGFINDTKGRKPVKTARSDKQGKFCIYHLMAGQYSVVIREPKGLYANLFDIDNRINPVTVRPGKVSTIRIEITHQSVF